jgi:hypothetical protein
MESGGVALSKRRIDKRRRRVALVVCALATVLWALFAVKDIRQLSTPQLADPCTRVIVLRHLTFESRSPLCGETNISSKAHNE